MIKRVSAGFLTVFLTCDLAAAAEKTCSTVIGSLAVEAQLFESNNRTALLKAIADEKLGKRTQAKPPEPSQPASEARANAFDEIKTVCKTDDVCGFQLLLHIAT
jgi:hypothetical protein